MMRRIRTMRLCRTMGLCVIAAFALTALFAATAQAKHANTGPIKFTAVSTNTPNFEPEGAGEVTCASETAAGEITTAVSGHMTAVFVGCATEGKQCNSAGEPEGTIKTEELKTETGYINKAKGEVGTDFKAASGEFYAKFDCPGTPDIYIAVKESVIGRLEPPNVLATTSTWDLKGSLARQEVEKFGSSGSKDTLVFEVSTKGQAGWEIGEFVSFGGVENVDSITTYSEQEEHKGKKINKYPDAAEVITTGAQPEYVRCRRAKQAKWSNAVCTEKAIEKHGRFKGKYELIPVPS
jgi:hypothetical protein